MLLLLLGWLRAFASVRVGFWILVWGLSVLLVRSLLYWHCHQSLWQWVCTPARRPRGWGRCKGCQREDNKIVKQLFNEKHFLHIALPLTALRRVEGRKCVLVDCCSFHRSTVAATEDDDVVATGWHGPVIVKLSEVKQRRENHFMVR